MFRILLTIVMISVFSFPAQAKIPDEVLKPYKAYSAALDEGDAKAVTKHAKKAWKAAEALLGDHKTTGDLAQNYADSLGMVYSKDQRKAYERSIELAHFHGDFSGDVKIQRQIKMTEASRYDRRRNSSQHPFDLRATDRMIESLGFNNSTYHAEAIFLRSRYEMATRKPDRALTLIDASIAMFDSADDGVFSIYPYLAKLARGDILLAQGEKIDAALQYQKVMQNVEGEIPADNPYVKRAFGDWMSLRFEFEDEGILEEAEAAGVCECWPFGEYRNQLQPIKRVPPTIPRDAERSGHTNLIFDVTDDGRTTNIRIVNSTSSVFDASSKASVEKWIYSPSSEGADPKSRKDIVTKIEYRLTKPGGELIPE